MLNSYFHKLGYLSANLAGTKPYNIEYSDDLNLEAQRNFSKSVHTLKHY